MASVMYDQLLTCPNCGKETPSYGDCIMCGYSLEDPEALPRDVSQDEIQEMMADAKLEEVKARRQALYDDTWDHAPWLERLEQLAEIAPENAKVHYYIGAGLTEKGQHREAIVSFTRALIVDPEMVEAIRRRGDSQYILVPVLAEDVQTYYDRALADYEATLELEPDVYTYNVHGSIIASLGELEAAVDDYNQAIELDPSYPESYFNRGYAYKLLSEDEQAIADLEKFLSFDAHWSEEMVAQAKTHLQELVDPDAE
jgi:tetratricopeptide (TPR) repeat protein